MKRALAAVTAVSAALLAGCETTVTTADGSAPALRPTEATPPPASARPNALAVTFAPKPTDSNGNSLPDTLHITAYLFSRPHPSPMFADGSFHFAIYRTGEAGTAERPGEAPLRTWSFSEQAVGGARSASLAGPCHEFVLSLLDSNGSDVLPVESVDLVAWFKPADGSASVWLRGVRGVQFPKPER